MRIVGIAALATAMVAAAPSAVAETSRTFQVAATIANGCVVTLTSGLLGTVALGGVSGGAGGVANGDLLSASGAGFQLDCTPGMSVSLAADAGQQAAGGVRQLAGPSGSTPIPYLLFVNGGTAPWATQSVSLSFPDGTSRQIIPVHARATVPAGTMGGTYTDTVRVTFSW